MGETQWSEFRSKDAEDEAAYTTGKISCVGAGILIFQCGVRTGGVDNGRCRVDPGLNDDQKSFGVKLDECNGILKAPRVGDSELLKPAPTSWFRRIAQPRIGQSLKVAVVRTTAPHNDS